MQWRGLGVHWLSEIEWAAWTQAALAFIALVVGPQALKVLWDTLATQFDVTGVSTVSKSNQGAEEWQFRIFNRTTRMRPFSLRIYQTAPGNLIAYADVSTEEDGGLCPISATLMNGALVLNVDHFGPLRVLELRLKFAAPDIPQVHSNTNAIRPRIDLRKENGRLMTNAVLPTIRMRLMMLLFNFWIAVIGLILWMIYLGIRNQFSA